VNNIWKGKKKKLEKGYLYWVNPDMKNKRCLSGRFPRTKEVRKSSTWDGEEGGKSL
jgi:hypothetical protein